jgi:hypothetical protein
MFISCSAPSVFIDGLPLKLSLGFSPNMGKSHVFLYSSLISSSIAALTQGSTVTNCSAAGSIVTDAGQLVCKISTSVFGAHFDAMKML